MLSLVISSTFMRQKGNHIYTKCFISNPTPLKNRIAKMNKRRGLCGFSPVTFMGLSVIFAYSSLTLEAI